MNPEYSFLLKIIRSILHDADGPLPDEDVDYSVLFRIAQNNSVANTIANTITKDPHVPSEIKQAFQKQFMTHLAQQAFCDHALEELYSSLDEIETRGVFLKGALLRRLYPKPFLRSMSDIDVFAEESSMPTIHRMMLDAAYETGTIGFGNHYEYMRDRMVKIEFHPELVALDSTYGKMIFEKMHPDAPSVAAAMNIWDHVMPVEGHSFAFRLTPEYHYVYVIMHMMRHFLGAGTGIRSMMDIYVMNDYYADTWDRDSIESLLEDYGLSTFEKYALCLTDKWFDLGELSYLPEEIDEELLLLFEEYILESGTYGSDRHAASAMMRQQTTSIAKAKYLLGRFFLSYNEMKEKYPVLTKHPLLLPVFWPYRVIQMFQHKGSIARAKLKTVAAFDQAQADTQKKLFEELCKW